MLQRAAGRARAMRGWQVREQPGGVRQLDWHVHGSERRVRQRLQEHQHLLLPHWRALLCPAPGRCRLPVTRGLL